MQPRSWMLGWLALIRLITELCLPFITLALSELNAITFSQGIFLLLLETGKQGTKCIVRKKLCTFDQIYPKPSKLAVLQTRHIRAAPSP